MSLKYRKAVFVVVYSIDKNKTGKNRIEYLLLKRKKHWKGWEFTKGGINPKETKLNAAKREMKEETGLRILKVKSFSFSGVYDYEKLLKDRPGVKGQTFSLFAIEAKKGRVVLDKKEHSGHRWFSFKEAEKKLTWPNQKISLRIVNDFLEEKSH